MSVDGTPHDLFASPQRGDVIVFTPPKPLDQAYVKRIIGLPGGKVTFRGGAVLVDDLELDEPYVPDEETRCSRIGPCEVVVPPDSVYVLGDHRGSSVDSRVFGPVPRSNIVGKAWFTYLPFDDLGLVSSPYDASEPAASPAATPQ